MKKEIASRLNAIAEKLPNVFKQYDDTVLMLGSELKLTPIGDNQELDPAAYYKIWIPKFVAVEHKQQLKDTYKRGGWPAVDVYCLEVLDSIGALRGVNVKEALETKNKTKSCSKSCGPGDWREGGKCDINGCFKK